MPTDPLYLAGARLARASRSQFKHNQAEIDDARRELNELKLAKAIRQTIAAAPPLTAEQRTRLATLLMFGDVA